MRTAITKISLRMRAVLSLPSSFVNNPISTISNDLDNEHRIPWSDCADAQADMGIHCSRMVRGPFSHLRPILHIPFMTV